MTAARPEVLAFLRAAKENPEDDTPRLVLADWLAEHGDAHDAARADFIRLQCEMALAGTEPYAWVEALQARRWTRRGRTSAPRVAPTWRAR